MTPGAYQYFAVPPNVAQVTLRIWGAGGCGGSPNCDASFALSGGAGGYLLVTTRVTPLDLLRVTVGQFGGRQGGCPAGNPTTNDPAPLQGGNFLGSSTFFPGGGIQQGGSGNGNQAGSGGGFSAVEANLGPGGYSFIGVAVRGFPGPFARHLPFPMPSFPLAHHHFSFSSTV